MDQTYIINNATLYIEKKEDIILVFEIEKELQLNNTSTKKVLNDSCTFYGSSYKGRKEGTQNMITETYKLPIIIKDNPLLVMFPIDALRSKKSTWINHSNIIDYHQLSNSKVLVNFKGGKKKIFNVSYYSFHQQISKCSRLILVYNNRIM